LGFVSNLKKLRLDISKGQRLGVPYGHTHKKIVEKTMEINNK
jgi:hypothetical protein